MTQKYQVKVSMKQAAIVETGIVLKQGDFGIQIEIEVLDFDATGTTPQIVFRKAMGAVESTTITVSSNKYTYTFKGTELDTPGKVFCDLKLKNSTTQRISTASFMFKVVADTLDGLAEESSSYSDTIEQIIGQYDDDVKTINENIAPTYSASSTYAVGDYVIYRNSLYRCKTAINTAEAWTAAHWEAAVISTETADLKNASEKELTASLRATGQVRRFIGTTSAWVSDSNKSGKLSVASLLPEEETNQTIFLYYTLSKRISISGANPKVPFTAYVAVKDGNTNSFSSLWVGLSSNNYAISINTNAMNAVIVSSKFENGGYLVQENSFENRPSATELGYLMIRGTYAELASIDYFYIVPTLFGKPMAENLKVEPTTLYHVLVTGQSLSVGAEGTPALTVTCPNEYTDKAFMFNGQARIFNKYNSPSLQQTIPWYSDDADMCSLTGLHEKDDFTDHYSGGELIPDKQGETICSGIGYRFAEETGKKILVSNHGFGGKSYQNLKKGTICYYNTIKAVKRAKAICEQYGWNYKVIGICIVHGEADTTYNVTTETYMGYLEEWQNDYDTDIKAITGQSETVKFYLSQTGYAGCEGKDAHVANADYLESMANPNKFKLVCPQYIWPINYVSSHMDGNGYRTLGEFFGQTIWRDFMNQPSRTIYPIKSVTSGNTITITLNVLESANIQFDETRISVTDGNHGFDLIDNGGAVITNIAVTSRPYTVIITCDQAPQNDAIISYAYKAKEEYTGHLPGYQTGCRGSLRGTDWFVPIHRNDPLNPDRRSYPDWCCVFAIPINYNPWNI